MVELCIPAGFWYICTVSPTKENAMSKRFFTIPEPLNEPILSYAPPTPERRLLQQELHAAMTREVDIPMYIGGAKVRTGNTVSIHPPHAHKHVLGKFH